MWINSDNSESLKNNFYFAFKLKNIFINANIWEGIKKVLQLVHVHGITLVCAPFEVRAYNLIILIYLLQYILLLQRL